MSRDGNETARAKSPRTRHVPTERRGQAGARRVDEEARTRRRAAVGHGETTERDTGRLASPLIEPSLQALDALSCEALALSITSDGRPLAGLASYVDWRLCGRLSALLRSGAVTGVRGESVLMPSLDMVRPRRIFLLGWGPCATLHEDAPSHLEWMVSVLAGAGCQSIALALPEPGAPLVHLVDEHVRKALGERCAAVFAPDPLVKELRASP